MKFYCNFLKKSISAIFAAVIFITAAAVSAAEGTPLLSDSGYAALDLSLTKTLYNEIGQTGVVKAAVIKEKEVTMYASPYYSNTETNTSEKYYAVKVDAKSTNDNYTYQRNANASKTTFSSRAQRVMLESSQLSYATDNTSVATVSKDGVITITGYGIAGISVTYNGGTPDDLSDDINGAVSVLAIAPDGNIQAVDNTLQWEDDSHTSLEMRINRLENSSLNDILEPSNIRFYPKYITSAFDPIGDDTSPLTMQVTGNGNLSFKSNYVSDATVSSDNASLIEAEYAENSRIMMQGWYYESGKGKSDTTIYPKLSFAYMGMQGANSVWQDGRRTWQIGSTPGGNYRIWGGDANVFSSSTNILNKDRNASGVTYLKATAEQNYSGIDTSIPATKGWHQFVVTAEPSMINPGTDYVLTRVYLDGVLITSQDIYVGDIDIAKRRVNIFLPKLESSLGFTSDSIGADANNYIHYKGLCITRFDRSETVTDSIPLNGAQNVPLYQSIKVKLGTPVESLSKAGISLNGKAVKDARLDESKTVITINPGKLSPDTNYKLSVSGSTINFRTTKNEDMSNVLDDMKTYGYSVVNARSIDFADSSKSAEEYGIGYLRHNAALKSNVSDGVATFEEEARSSQSDSGYNAVLLRNLTEYDSKADRIVVSYKVKLNVPSGYSGDSEYTFPETTKHSGGIGVPIIAKKNETRVFSPVVRTLLPGATGSDPTGSSSLPVPEVANGQISLMNLLNKNTGRNNSHAYSLSGGQLWNTRTAQTSFDLWRQIAYVIDVDTTGVKAPKWYFIDINSATKTLNSKSAIYELTVPAAYGEGYTWVDSLYIPITRLNASASTPTSFSVKDVEIYSLKLDASSQVENTLEVFDSASSQIVYADELSGKTVDVTIKGYIPKDSIVVFSAFDKKSGNMRLEDVKTVKLQADTTLVTEKLTMPESDNTELCVFVRKSFTEANSYASKYVYSLTN